MQALRRVGRRSLSSRKAENSRPSRPAHVTGKRVRGFLPRIRVVPRNDAFRPYFEGTEGFFVARASRAGISPPAGGGKRAAARRRRTRGDASSPSCESPPPRDVTGCPRPPPNFLHMLWKNLRCDNVASVAFCAGAGRRGRPAVTVRRLSGFTQRFFRMLLRCCTRSRQDAPAYPGVRGNTVCAELPPLRTLVFLSVPMGNRGAKRPVRRLKSEGKGMIDKRGKTAGCPPFVRPPRSRRSPCLGKHIPRGGNRNNCERL